MMSRNVQLPQPISAGVMLSYKCTAACRHCLYSCSPEWKADWISEGDLDHLFALLQETIQPAAGEPDAVGLSSGVHLSGGEPFMNFNLLLRATEIATHYNIPSLFVETNASWCANDATAREKLSALKSAGMKGIMISVNPYYAEYVPFERTERCIRTSLEIFGRNTMVYQLEYYRQFKLMGIRDTLSLEKYLAMAGVESLSREVELFLMGKATDALEGYYPSRPASAYINQPCQPAFLRTWHNHFDNYGNYMPGFCGGISLARWDQTDTLSGAEIDLTDKPVLEYLVSDDFEGLLNYARESGFTEYEDGYISKCHLCLDIRKHLHRKNPGPDLAPDEFYNQLNSEK